MKNHLVKSILCIILLVASSGLAGCQKTYTTTTGAADISTGVHTLTGVESIGTPMTFEGMQATVFGDVENPQQVLVFTHGDGGKADYLLPHAQKMAAGTPGLVTMVLARPGCKLERRQSVGVHSNKNYGSHYSRGKMDAYGNSLLAIKEYFHPTTFMAFGHSGGAQTLAICINDHPDLLDGVVLVSIPGDIPRWRIYRNWTPKRGSLSPHDHVKNIARDTRIIVITGGADTNTTPWLAQIYVDAVRAAGHENIEFIILPGTSHNRAADFTPEMEQLLRGMLSTGVDTAILNYKKATN